MKLRAHGRRAWAVAVAMTLLLLVAAAPGGAQETTRVTIGLNGFENNVTPFTHSFLAFPNTHDLVHLVYDSLFWSQASDDPEPWLAESAESSDDARVWTVKLREGVTWHDGEPFTADDVAFSMEYYVEHTADSGRYAHHVADMPKFERAEVVDDHTVRLHFAHPASQFKIMPGADLPIIPRHQWEAIDEPGSATEMLPIGTGPYELVEIVPDQQYRFEANKDYFKGQPLVDELVMPIIREPAAAFAALQTGDVDYVARSVPPELVEAFERIDDIEVVRGTIFESMNLFLNVPRPPLDDPQLRRAMAMAIDNEAILETVLLGNGEPGRDSYLHPRSPWAIEEELREFDPEAAKRLLDEAGYDQTGEDGVRLTPDGERLELGILVSTFEPQQIRVSQLVAAQLGEVGIEVQVEALDPATIRQRRRPPESGGAAPYDIRTGALEAHAHVDPDALYYFFHSPGERGFGGVITGYANPQFDQLAEAAGMSDNLDERRKLLADMQRILAEDVPVITVMYPEGIWAFRPDAYDGFFADFGHSPLTKRSFLPDYAETGDQDRIEQTPGAEQGDDAERRTTDETGQDAGGQVPWGPIVAVVALLAVVGAVVALMRRKRGDSDYD